MTGNEKNSLIERFEIVEKMHAERKLREVGKVIVTLDIILFKYR